MKEYIIFHYRIEGQSYVEAYPMHAGFLTGQCAGLLLAQPVGVVNNEWAIVSSPSRTEARRAAYCNWVCASGAGFNQLPYRVYAPGKLDKASKV